KEISLAVTVVSKEISQVVEIEIVRIAKTLRDDLTLFAVGREPEQGATLGRANERMGTSRVVPIKAAIVPANDIPPAVRPLAHGMAAVFSISQRQQMLGRAIGLSFAVAVPVARQPASAAEIKVVAVEAHAHAALRGSRKQRSLIRLA